MLGKDAGIKRNAIGAGLGWAINKEGSRYKKLTQLFNFSEDDIAIANPTFMTGVYQVDNEDEIKKMFTSIVGGGLKKGSFEASASYETRKQDAQTKRKNYTVLYAVYKKSCTINKPSIQLALRLDIDTDNIGTHYVASGDILFGYRIIIRGDIETFQSSNLASPDVFAKVFNAVHAKYGYSDSHGNSANKSTINITVEGFGDYRPVCNIIDPNNFNAGIKALNDDLNQKINDSIGYFEYGESNLEPYSKNKLYEDNFGKLHALIQDTKKLLENSLGLDMQERIHIEGELQCLIQKINDNKANYIILEKDKTKVHAQLEEVIAAFYAITQEITDYKIVSLDNYSRVSTTFNGQTLYLGVKSDRIQYEIKERSTAFKFKVKVANESQSHNRTSQFYLVTDNGKYISLNPGDQKYLILANSINKAIEWQLIREGSQYCLATTNHALSKPKLGDSDFVELCDLRENQRAMFVVDDYMLQHKLQTILGTIRDMAHNLSIKLNENELIVSNDKGIFLKSKIKEIYAAQLIYDIFPKIRSCKAKSVSFVIGNTGAGKSSLVNALLGRTFITDEQGFVDIKDKSKLHAKIGNDTSKSETQYPSAYPIANTVVIDFPGFNDTEGEAKNRLNHFNMYILKEIVNEIKSIFIVVGYGELENAKSAYFKSLMHIISRMLRDEALEVIRDKFVFVVNFKNIWLKEGNPQKAVLKFIKSATENFKEKIDQYDSYMNKLQEKSEQDSSLWQTLAKTAKGGMEKIKNTAILRVLGVTAKETEQGEKIEDVRRAKKILELMTEDNIVLWRDHRDVKFRQSLLDRIQSKDLIPKDYFLSRFEDANNKEHIRMLNEYLEEDLETLIEYDNRIKSTEAKIRQLMEKISFNTGNQDEKEGEIGKIKVRIEEGKERLKCRRQEHIEFQNEPSSYGVVSLPEKRSGGRDFITLSGHWKVESELKFDMTGENYFTHIQITEKGYKLVPLSPFNLSIQGLNVGVRAGVAYSALSAASVVFVPMFFAEKVGIVSESSTRSALDAVLQGPFNFFCGKLYLYTINDHLECKVRKYGNNSETETIEITQGDLSKDCYDSIKQKLISSSPLNAAEEARIFEFMATKGYRKKYEGMSNNSAFLRVEKISEEPKDIQFDKIRSDSSDDFKKYQHYRAIYRTTNAFADIEYGDVQVEFLTIKKYDTAFKVQIEEKENEIVSSENEIKHLETLLTMTQVETNEWKIELTQLERNLKKDRSMIDESKSHYRSAYALWYPIYQMLIGIKSHLNAESPFSDIKRFTELCEKFYRFSYLQQPDKDEIDNDSGYFTPSEGSDSEEERPSLAAFSESMKEAGKKKYQFTLSRTPTKIKIHFLKSEDIPRKEGKTLEILKNKLKDCLDDSVSGVNLKEVDENTLFLKASDVKDINKTTRLLSKASGQDLSSQCPTFFKPVASSSNASSPILTTTTTTTTSTVTTTVTTENQDTASHEPEEEEISCTLQ